MGLTDVPYEKSVKLYCGRCEDIYSPKSSRHGSIDGAYFGTSFPHLLFLVYPNLIPPKSGPVDFGRSTGEDASRRRRKEEPELPAEGFGETISTAAVALKADRYRPKIFGFQVHEIAKLQRWQEAVRDRCALRSTIATLITDSTLQAGGETRGFGRLNVFVVPRFTVGHRLSIPAVTFRAASSIASSASMCSTLIYCKSHKTKS